MAAKKEVTPIQDFVSGGMNHTHKIKAEFAGHKCAFFLTSIVDDETSVLRIWSPQAK